MGPFITLPSTWTVSYQRVKIYLNINQSDEAEIHIEYFSFCCTLFVCSWIILE